MEEDFDWDVEEKKRNIEYNDKNIFYVITQSNDHIKPFVAIVVSDFGYCFCGEKFETISDAEYHVTETLKPFYCEIVGDSYRLYRQDSITTIEFDEAWKKCNTINDAISEYEKNPPSKYKKIWWRIKDEVKMLWYRIKYFGYCLRYWFNIL